MTRAQITTKVPIEVFKMLDQKAAQLRKSKQDILAPIIEKAIRDLQVPEEPEP